MEINIRGEGTATIRFIDPEGRVLIQQSLTASGSPTIQAQMTVNLIADTAKGKVPLSPVLMSSGNKKQEIQFDGQQASSFTRKKCLEIGCNTKVAEEAAHGRTEPFDKEGISALFRGAYLPKLDKPKDYGYSK